MKIEQTSTSADLVAVRSPGRINIIGEHTDYNGGFVLPAAIDKEVIVRIRRNGSPDRCTLHALDFDATFSFSLHAVQPQPAGWQNYLLGVVHEVQALGGKLSGFDAEISGNVPSGGGMSSSAALECSMGYALNQLFALGLDDTQLIEIAQRAEHNFVGTRCGIMDMFASVRGKAGHVIRLDCRSLEYGYFPLELGEYELLLLNTNVSHSLAESAYNQRREECEEAVRILSQAWPEIRQLRDVTVAMLEEALPKLPDPIAQRCRHVVTENQRVKDTTQALQQGDLKRVGALLYASHRSLQHDYEVSCPELDFLVDQATQEVDILGGRLMGGGFGGCTINLVRRSQNDRIIEKLNTAYRKAFQRDLTPYTVELADGTSEL